MADIRMHKGKALYLGYEAYAISVPTDHPYKQHATWYWADTDQPVAENPRPCACYEHLHGEQLEMFHE